MQLIYTSGTTGEPKGVMHSANSLMSNIVRYAERDLLQSGWLIGEKHIAKKAAMVSAKYGEGKVILIGFRTQNRAQTHGTFKLFFNALLQ